jgi:hypothetical protein
MARNRTNSVIPDNKDEFYVTFLDSGSMKEQEKLVQTNDDHRAQLEALAEENRQLRLAADAFGQLAERLNDELRRLHAQRPRVGDRR